MKTLGIIQMRDRQYEISDRGEYRFLSYEHDEPVVAEICGCARPECVKRKQAHDSRLASKETV